ncbi:MAG TPA: hypothetical protein VEW69_09820 [Alphaproteobacteria bacterium]|nr:hypothetical protein [Alphaproteobacteria bacterium]
MSHPIRRIAAVLVFFFALAASAQVQKLDNLSFAVPDGWKFEYTPDGQHADMVWTNANGAFCIILLSKPTASSGSVENDFAATWRSGVEHNPQATLPNPLYDIRGMVGYPGKYSGSEIENRSKYVFLYVLETGKSFVPVLVIAPNRSVHDALQETLRTVIGSIRVAPLTATPVKSTVSVADLVGDWKYGDASVVSYVNSSTGTYAGSSATFTGEFYTITADGRYTYNFQGMTGGHIVREKSAGVVEFSGEFIVFHEKPSNKLVRYHFIAYEQGLGGATLLTLLPESYEVNSSNTAVYASRFVREPAKK